MTGCERPPLSDEEALRIYVRSCPTDIYARCREAEEASRRREIADEVRFLLAHDLAQAKEHIRWWGCWRNEEALTNYVRKVKRLGREAACAK